MAIDGKNNSPEREQTDESLRTERERTDSALAEQQARVEEDADVLVQRARENADATLTAARGRADERLETRGGDHGQVVTLVAERALEDDALRDERAAADQSVRQERTENARALARLLPLERQKTDRYLLTERLRSDDALAHRDDFLGIVSHDLRNLLGGIVMSAQLLTDCAADHEGSEQTIEGGQRIQRYAARMHRLIGDLVDVASIDAGKLSVTPSRSDATATIAEAVDMFRASAEAKGVALIADVSGPSVRANFDRERILQVLANLITNSIKFTPSAGTIRVRGERTGDDLLFSVTDTGKGIPAPMLQVVFERFWQVGKSDRRGLGLGLYISKCLVEAHGGRIWAESVVERGTKIAFALPIA
jgi:signal transduction histidine kinase